MTTYYDQDGKGQVCLAPLLRVELPAEGYWTLNMYSGLPDWANERHYMTLDMPEKAEKHRKEYKKQAKIVRDCARRVMALMPEGVYPSQTKAQVLKDGIIRFYPDENPALMHLKMAPFRMWMESPDTIPLFNKAMDLMPCWGAFYLATIYVKNEYPDLHGGRLYNQRAGSNHDFFSEAPIDLNHTTLRRIFVANPMLHETMKKPVKDRYAKHDIPTIRTDLFDELASYWEEQKLTGRRGGLTDENMLEQIAYYQKMFDDITLIGIEYLRSTKQKREAEERRRILKQKREAEERRRIREAEIEAAFVKEVVEDEEFNALFDHDHAPQQPVHPGPPLRIMDDNNQPNQDQEVAA